MKKTILFFTLICVFISAYANSTGKKIKNDEVVIVEDNDPYMEKAMEIAKETLETFFKYYESEIEGAQYFALKVGVSEGDNTEYFWVEPFKKLNDNLFVGVLNGEPQLVSNVTSGQDITFNSKDIVDWTYIKDGKMKGNITLCALLMNESKQERESLIKDYGLDCSKIN